MAIAGSAMSSVHLTFIGGQLLMGGNMMRHRDVVCGTAEEAWKELLEKGEAYLQLYGMNLHNVQELYAAWVFEQGQVIHEQG